MSIVCTAVSVHDGIRIGIITALIPNNIAHDYSIHDQIMSDDGDKDPLSDPEERRVLYAALDSFRSGYF